MELVLLQALWLLPPAQPPALPQHLDTLFNPLPVTESSWERETAALRGEVTLGHARFSARMCSPNELSRALTLPGCALALLQGVHFIRLALSVRHIEIFFLSVKLLYFDIH